MEIKDKQTAHYDKMLKSELKLSSTAKEETGDKKVMRQLYASVLNVSSACTTFHQSTMTRNTINLFRPSVCLISDKAA